MYRLFWLALVFNLILSSTALAVSFSADSITPMLTGQRPEIGKLYYQNSNLYRSEAMGIISIVKESSVYSLVTDTKKYTVESLDELRKKSPISVWGDAMDMIKKNKMKKVGKEKLQGYKCVIYEGDMMFPGSQTTMRVKIWYSKKLKNILKQEMKLPAPMGVVSSHLENITIGKQSSSLFDVPAGYTQVKDLEEAMGMGNFGMSPGGGKDNQMPSEEDMKKMMEQMQNMMKNMQQ